MMRFHAHATLLLAGALGIPALIAQEPGAMNSLQAAIDSTRQAIDDLVGLSKGLEARDPRALEKLLESTEPPALDSAERAQRIEFLQREIEGLARDLAAGPSVELPSETSSSAPPPSGPITPAPPGPGPGPGAVTPVPAVERASLESPTYSADEMQRARLYVRAGRALEALEILAQLEATPETRYWTARANKEIGEEELALEMLNALAQDPLAERYAVWAKHDAQVLSLEIELRSRSKAPEGGSRK